MKQGLKARVGCLALSAAFLCTCLFPAGLIVVQAEEDSPAAVLETEETGVHVSDEEGLLQYLAGAEEGNISLVLDTDITLTAQLNIAADMDVALCGATGAETITAGSSWTDLDGMFAVEGALSLSGITVNGNRKSRLIYVKEGGTLTIEAGSTLTGGTQSGIGAGIYNQGTVTMNGGSIIKNTTSTYGVGFGGGGGVYNAGSFTMNDGTVGANTAAGGGGFFSTGTLTINGGIVTGNTVSLGNTNEMNATGKCCGGGVYVESGTFTLTGGTISKNMANNNMNNTYTGVHKGKYPEGVSMGCGAGVYVSNQGAVFIMEGGAITGNTAYGKTMEADTPRCGGGVYVQGGTDAAKGKTAGVFYMYGGSITGNKCQSFGGGVYLATEEYAVYTNGSGGGYSEAIVPGAASMYIGDSVVISGNCVFTASGNTDNDLYLPKGMVLHISKMFDENAEIHVNAESSLLDTVLADYSEDVEPLESDLDIFTVAGARGLELRESEEAKANIVLSLADLEQGGTLSLAKESYVYTGAAIKPEVTVTDRDGNVLKEGTDYAVTYLSHINAGTEAAVVVSGRGDYKGELRKEFTIEPLSIDGADSPVSISECDLTKGTLSYDYDGSEHKPKLSSIELTDNVREEKLYYNDDYTVEYTGDTVQPGTVTVTIKGIGNYTGSLSYSYVIHSEAVQPEVNQPEVNQPEVNQPEVNQPEVIIPEAPLLKSVENVSNGVTVKWSAAKDASGYYVYRKAGSGSWQKIATVSGASKTSYTDKAVKGKNGGIYSYTVQAYNGENVSTYDTAGKKIVRLKAPTLKKTSSKSAKKMTVTWTRNKKATGYQVQYSTSKKFSSAKTVKIGKNKTVTKTVSKLKAGKKYYVRVRCISKAGKTSYYSVWSKTGNVKVKK